MKIVIDKPNMMGYIIGMEGREMKAYRIMSKAGVDMGTYAGKSPEDAVRSMIADGSGEYGSTEAGTAEDYNVEEEPTLREHLSKAGRAKSPAKSAAARVNGARGGRPRDGFRAVDLGGETHGFICCTCAAEHVTEEYTLEPLDESGECYCCGSRVSGK